jgi:hypothetical protein
VHIHGLDATLADTDFPALDTAPLRRWRLGQQTRRTGSAEKHPGGNSRRALQELPSIAHCISPVQNG